MSSLLSMLLLLVSCFAIMLASLSGKLFVWRGAGAFIERNLHLMVSFAGGVFLIFAWQLSREVFEHMEVLPAFLWIAGGALGVTLLCKLFKHGAVALDGEQHHNHPQLDAHRMLVSDSVHNVGDGILLAATFGISPFVGLAATVSVFLHEAVQEIAEFFVLRDAGYSVRRALLLNFATSATILVGAIGGYFLLDLFETLEAPLLALATGGVLSVVFLDLFPHSLRDAHAKSTVGKHILWIIIGCVLMYGVTTLVPHEDPKHNEETPTGQLSNP